MDAPKDIITICMGSSCFSRGNNETVVLIEQFIKDHNLSAKVEMAGSLCDGNCKSGPNIAINGEIISGIDKNMINDLLTHTFLSNTEKSS